MVRGRPNLMTWLAPRLTLLRTQVAIIGVAIFLVMDRGTRGAMARSTDPRHPWLEDTDYALLYSKVRCFDITL